MQNPTRMSVQKRTVSGILIPASQSLREHGYSHLLMDDHRGIYLVHECRKSGRMSLLNRTRVEISGAIQKVPGEHPRLFVRSYCLADSLLQA